MHTLAIIQNTWTTIEMMLVTKITHVAINTNYCKSDTLIHSVRRLLPEVNVVNLNEAKSMRWDTVISTTCFEDAFNCDCRIFVEDGSYDYTEHLAPKKDHLNSDLYLFKPSLSTMRQYFKSVKKIDIKDAVSLAIGHLFDRSLPEDVNTPVLFTAPPEAVNQKFVDSALDTYPFLIVKQHPRDERTITLRRSQILCSRDLPGQVLTRIYNGPFLYEHNSTVKLEEEF